MADGEFPEIPDGRGIPTVDLETFKFAAPVQAVIDADIAVTQAAADAAQQTADAVQTAIPLAATLYGVTGDDVDSSAAMQAALTAANAGGRALTLPPGRIRIDSATRLVLDENYTSLIGDPSGTTILSFHHASGGIDVGNGTDFVYQNLIQNLVIDGFNVAANPLRLRKSEELGMVNVRVTQATSHLIETTDTSLFHSSRLQLSRAPIGIKTLGYLGTFGLIDANFYLLDAIVSCEGTGITNLVVSGTSFIEAVKAGVVFNRPGGLISVGTIMFRDCYVTSTLTEFSLFKGVASTGVNAAMLIATDLNAYLPNVTTAPFVNFTALSNNGSTLRARLIRATFTVPALGSGKLVAVNAAQNWFQFFVTLRDIVGATTAQLATAFATGGVALSPLWLEGSGTPEGAQTAPVGSIYQNYGGGAGTSLYVKQVGTGNTGWVGK